MELGEPCQGEPCTPGKSGRGHSMAETLNDSLLRTWKDLGRFQRKVVRLPGSHSQCVTRCRLSGERNCGAQRDTVRRVLLPVKVLAPE